MRLDRAQVAMRVTRLLDGQSLRTRILVAVLALALAGSAGMLLANQVEHAYSGLTQSRFFAQLERQGERSRLMRILTEPDGSELLLRYANATAVALANLEQSPLEQLARFETLWAAQKTSGARIVGFLSDDAGGRLTIRLVGEADQACTFLEEIRKNERFSEARLREDFPEDLAEYTIENIFADVNL